MIPPAVILAGGMSRRMGGTEKAFVDLDGRRLIDRVIDRLAPQGPVLAINANGDAGRFAGLGCPVLPDPRAGFPGPLAGLLAAMDWAASQASAMVVTAPVDCPFLPDDLIARFLATGGACVAETSGGLHPVCGLWPVAAAPRIAEALDAGERRMRIAVEITCAVPVRFEGSPDPFFNVNTPEDLAAAEALLCRRTR